MGPHGVITTLMNGINPFVSHFSLDSKNNIQHLYFIGDSHKQSKKCHNPEDEFKILKWLHDNDKIDIAFCHNDLGNYATTPKLKEHAQKWAAKNLIKGGYMLSNNNYNRAKVNNIEIMKENNCEIIQLSEVVEKYNLSKLPFKRIEGYMISKKVL